MSSGLTWNAPRGWFRRVLRLPLVLYRNRLGWVFGRRFVFFTHTGRKSGQPHDAIVEVMRYEPDGHRCYVAAGWGARSQWYRNVLQDPRVTYVLGTNRYTGTMQPLDTPAVEGEYRVYAARHPLVIRLLVRVMLGERFTGDDAQFRKMAETMPVLRLQSTETDREPAA